MQERINTLEKLARAQWEKGDGAHADYWEKKIEDMKRHVKIIQKFIMSDILVSAYGSVPDLKPESKDENSQAVSMSGSRGDAVEDINRSDALITIPTSNLSSGPRIRELCYFSLLFSRVKNFTSTSLIYKITPLT